MVLFSHGTKPGGRYVVTAKYRPTVLRISSWNLTNNLSPLVFYHWPSTNVFSNAEWLHRHVEHCWIGLYFARAYFAVEELLR